jgi:hypothetical protein
LALGTGKAVVVAGSGSGNFIFNFRRITMGRELRMVTADWEHPRDDDWYVPLRYGYQRDCEEFQQDVEKHGLEWALKEWGGEPLEERYMLPDATPEELTHYMMYDNSFTAGQPISPAFETKEELARWLADTGASAFGRLTATYEAWLATIERGHAISAFFSSSTGLISGVEAVEAGEKMKEDKQ